MIDGSDWMSSSFICHLDTEKPTWKQYILIMALNQALAANSMGRCKVEINMEMKQGVERLFGVDSTTPLMH